MNSFSDTLDQHKAYFASGTTLPRSWRVAQLKQLRSMLKDNEHQFYLALSEDLGKPIQESWVTEYSFVLQEINYALKHLKQWMQPRKVSTPLVAQPASSYVQPEPYGTVLIIGAWNYPIQLVLAPLVAVIAAGNCAVVKPSELAPACSRLVARLLPQYVDKQAVSVVEGGKEETTQLLALAYDHIMYTGNGVVGKIVMAAAAKHLTPVTLELGGKSPVYVDQSANLTITAQRLAWGKWINAGQTCVAPDYILATEAVARALVKSLQQQVKAMFGEEPRDSDSYGRIVNQRHTLRLQEYLHRQNVVCGGEVDVATKYLSPTIVLNPNVVSPLMQEEIFGPILPVVVIKDFTAACDFIKSRAKPLAAYLFTKDKGQQQIWQKQISAGSQSINDVFMFHAVPELPFGGVGASGMGRYSGKVGFDNFSHLKAVLKRPFLPDPAIRFAPYKDWKLALLKLLR